MNLSKNCIKYNFHLDSLINSIIFGLSELGELTLLKIAIKLKSFEVLGLIHDIIIQAK